MSATEQSTSSSNLGGGSEMEKKQALSSDSQKQDVQQGSQPSGSQHSGNHDQESSVKHHKDLLKDPTYEELLEAVKLYESGHFTLNQLENLTHIGRHTITNASKRHLKGEEIKAKRGRPRTVEHPEKPVEVISTAPRPAQNDVLVNTEGNMQSDILSPVTGNSIGKAKLSFKQFKEVVMGVHKEHVISKYGHDAMLHYNEPSETVLQRLKTTLEADVATPIEEVKKISQS